MSRGGASGSVFSFLRNTSKENPMAREEIKKDTIDKKADYKKPQVQRVRLTINNPVLGLCFNGGSDPTPACNFSGALCAWP